MIIPEEWEKRLNKLFDVWHDKPSQRFIREFIEELLYFQNTEAEKKFLKKFPIHFHRKAWGEFCKKHGIASPKEVYE